VIGPYERFRVDNLRRAVYAMRLRSRQRIGARRAVFENETVRIARPGLRNSCYKILPVALQGKVSSRI